MVGTPPRWLYGAFVSLFLATGTAIAAWSVELPYLAWSPGPVGDAVEGVIVDEDVEAYALDGELLFLTVSSTQYGVNVYEMVAGALDPTVALVRREAVRPPDETIEEYRTRQLGLMDRSIETAITVALQRAGVDPGPLRYRVVEVLGDFPGAQALEPGDVLFEVDGRPVLTADDPRTALADNEPGDSVKIVVERGDQVLEFEIELGQASDDEERAVIGISVGQVIADPPVGIESGNIGGPSAGMMYTLAIIDLLGEGQLTKGYVIAGTGTIRGDGTVGNIGGVRQKVVAAEAAGADVMLVPRGNYDQALEAPRESMQLIPIDTIDDALAALAELDPA